MHHFVRNVGMEMDKVNIMSDKSIQITEFDLQRLCKLIREAQHTNYRGSEYLDELRAELNRAQIVPSQAVSQEVVTMNSIVVLLDPLTRKEETYTLVFPEDADIGQGKISILAPIGTAMLGCEVGDSFESKVPAGKRRMKVKQIVYQPEAAGDYHL
jgi:regulator of nucleoside diphosphate kinase